MEEKLAQLTPAQALVIGLVLAGIYFFAAFNDGTGIEKSIAAGKAQITDLESKRAKYNRDIAKAIEFEKLASELGGKVEEILTYIPEDLTVSELMKIISQEAKSVGANIMSVNDQSRRGGNSKEEFFERLGVDLTIEASYTQIMMFLSNMTGTKRVVLLNDFTISKQGRGTDNNQLIFKAQFTGFKYKGEG